MADLLLPEAVIDQCRNSNIHIEPDAQFGFGEPKETLLEAPLNVQRGIYDIDAIGAFTYLGGRETLMRHIATIGRFCSIASNVVTGQIEHPTDFLSAAPPCSPAHPFLEI